MEVASGYTLQHITYAKDGVTVVIPVGSKILVDVNRGIALFNGEHFDIFPDEWEDISSIPAC